MLKRLRDLGLGVHVIGLFMGAVCYADDVLLVAPTRSAMQRMLWEVEMFAKESNIEFSTDPIPGKSKTKCIFVVGDKKNLTKPAPLMLCGRELPYVSQVDHLGNILTEQGTMDQDAVVKRAKFIQSSVEVRETFKFAAPEEILRSLKTYCSSFYGSCLWDLGGEKAKQLYNSWNTAVKLAWGLPQYTRTYILQNVLTCGYMSAKVDILCRYVKFFDGLRSSASFEVQVLSRYVARDMQSITGKNIWLIQELTGLNPLIDCHNKVKMALHSWEQVSTPEADRWRLPYLVNLLRQRRIVHNLALTEEEDMVTELIDSLVKN